FTTTAPTPLYPLSLHDALPICLPRRRSRDRSAVRAADARGLPPGRQADVRPRGNTRRRRARQRRPLAADGALPDQKPALAMLLRSEEHTSELQSRGHLVCRLLL